MMPYVMMVGKLVLLMAGGGSYQEGVGAFYHQVDLREVCERRLERGWFPPGAGLLCGQPCLAAAVTSDPLQLGEYVLADLPGCSVHLCQIVDVAQEAHQEALLARGEVIEIDGETARECGWEGFVPGVRVWRVGKPSWGSAIPGRLDGLAEEEAGAVVHEGDTPGWSQTLARRYQEPHPNPPRERGGGSD